MSHLLLPRLPNIIRCPPRTKPFALRHRLQRRRLCMQHLGQRSKLHVELETRRRAPQSWIATVLTWACSSLSINFPSGSASGADTLKL